MSQNQIRPPWALGLCDRCGFSYRLNQLHEQIFDERPTGSLVCAACLDIDNPQLQLGRTPVDDPQTLINPRPDTGFLSSTSYFGWQPVGSPLTKVQCQVGNLTVVTV